QVEVLDEEDAVVTTALPSRQIGELADREQVVGLEQGEPVVEIEALPALHLLADRIERAVDSDGHQWFRSSVPSCLVGEKRAGQRRRGAASPKVRGRPRTQ